MGLDIRYYPLIDCTSDFSALRPMMPEYDEKAVKEHHSFWLAEAIPGSYRLCCTDAASEKLNGSFTVSCPLCGKDMKKIGGTINRNRHGLYLCDPCRKEGTE